jgi:PII-like signaling protein
VNEDCLKLTIYFGERARADGRFVADALAGIHARHELATSVVLRGAEGFGAKHMRTDRLLTLSEDLPLVSVAVDSRPRIEAALRDVGALRFSGLVTLERARMLTGFAQPPPDLREETKLTVYVGRGLRIAGTPAYRRIVDLMHRRGIAGATVLLGVDGTVHGSRERARFFAANDRVPLMIIAVGDGNRIGALLPELGALLPRALLTLERVRVCRRDGRRIADPAALPDTDGSGLPVWQKLMVYAGEQSPHAGHPLSGQLVRALRQAGAAGATSLRGIWGYHGDHRPHGDSFRRLRRRVPVVTVVVDTPTRMRDWFGIVAQMTDEVGLVTSEMVPAFRTFPSDHEPGALPLAALGGGR